MTSAFEIAAVMAAGVSALMGVLGMVAPRAALKLVGLQFGAHAPHAVSEARATFGGLFFAISIAAIVLDHPFAYAVVGAGWLGAAAMRLVSIVIDRVPTKPNVTALVFEAMVGGALLLKLHALL